jgi:hypothetical protein
VSESFNSNIVIGVDASRGIASLRELQNQAQRTSQTLRSMGGSSGGFDALQKQVSSLSNGFEALKSQVAATSKFNALAKELSGLSDSFGLVSNSVKVFTTVLGGVALGGLAKQISQTGNSFLSLRLAVDSTATSSAEAGQQLKFLFDLADRTGSNVEDLTNNFRNLYASMRNSGSSISDIQKVTSAFTTISSVLHLTNADSKQVMREIGETFAMGSAHATQVTRSIASHVPALVSYIKEALHMTGPQIHDQFKKGGFDPQVLWPAVADVILQKYGSALPEALQHSQSAMNQLSNVATKMRESIFENGFDQALTQLSRTIASAFSDSAIDSIGKTIGTGLRSAAAGAIILGQEIVRLKEPLAAFFAVFAGLPALRVGVLGLGAAFAFVTSPLVLVATGAALAAANWDTLKTAVSNASPAFGSMVNWIGDAVSRLFDLNKAMKGALELFTMAKGLLSGDGWDASLNAARKVGADFDSTAKQSGKTFAQGWFDGAKGVLDNAAKWLDERMSGVTSGYQRLMRDSTSQEFHGGGNYAANREAYGVKDNSLSEELKREWERITPLNRALLEYKNTLDAIEKMRGRVDPLGHTIGDSDISKLKNAAREKALSEGFPVVNKIQALSDSIRLEQEAIRNVGGNTVGEQIKIEREFLAFKQQMLRSHIELTREEETAVRALLTARNQLERGGENGFQRWANEQKSAFEGMQDNIKSGLDSISDGFSKLATEGKGKFKNLGEAIRAELRSVFSDIARNFIRTGIRSLMADALKQVNFSGLFGDNGLNANIAKALGLGQGVIDKANSALDDATKSMTSTVTGQMDVQAAVVNINGGIGGASGLTAFRPGSSIQDSINPQGAGGIVANNDNGAPLFSGNALPQFGANVRTGGLGSITKNSVAEFGKGLVPSLGALPGFKDALKSSADGITKNSAAAFGQGLQKLAPIADRIGVTPISGSLAELYKRAGLDKLTEKNLRTVHPDLQEAVLKAKMSTGANIMINDGMGIRTPAQAAANAAAGRGILHSKHLTGDAVDVLLKDKSGRLIEDGSNPAYRSFNDAMQSASGGRIKWGGTFSRKPDWDHWERIGGGGKGGHFGDLGDKLSDQSAKVAENLKKQIHETTRLATESQKSFTALAQATPSLSTFDGGVTKLADTMTAGVPAADGFGDQIAKLIEQLLSGIGGGGGGLGNAIGGLLGGIFEEGGYTTSPVSSANMPASFWAGAPHYAEGTPNTSGGVPAILHDNEAVIPLSRGREIPVRLEGAGVGDGGSTQPVIYNMNNNIHARDADSFRKNARQVGSDFYRMISRAHIRNA